MNCSEVSKTLPTAFSVAVTISSISIKTSASSLLTVGSCSYHTASMLPLSPALRLKLSKAQKSTKTTEVQFKGHDLSVVPRLLRQLLRRHFGPEEGPEAVEGQARGVPEAVWGQLRAIWSPSAVPTCAKATYFEVRG